VLALELEGGHRVMLRPSGTEPKIKFYFDVRVDVADGETISAARGRGNTLIAELVAALELIV
jgi:phosphomannomutase